MFYLSVALLVLLCASITQAADAPEHPRLLISKSDVPALRARIKAEPYASMFKQMLSTLEPKADEDAFEKPSAAHRAAFAYVLSGDDRYARRARELIEPVLRDKNWANGRIKGLRLYNEGFYAAMTYDHCFGAPSWDAAFSAEVSKKLREQAEVIMRSGGSEQNRSMASNWQGLRWSSAGVLLMASDEPITDPKALPACYRRVLDYLRANLSTEPAARGWNTEGVGYTYYPMGNGVAPFLIAMQRQDPTLDARKDVPATAWTLWTTYAALVKTPTGLFRPDFSDDNPGTRGEGCYGLAFYFAPPEILPGLKWWYDRTVGAQGDRTFDDQRFGNVASLLYYPADVKPAEPMSIPAWRDALIEPAGNGFVTFRNHYRDETDVVAQVFAKLRGNRGHSGPDALGFRIVGMGTIWATGGGRYGPKTNGQDVYWRSQNTVYPVDPDQRLTINGNSGKYVGKPEQFKDGGGSAVMKISANNVGATNHTRRFLADFATPTPTFVISDSTDNGRFWQLATLATNKITTDANTFLIQSPTGGTLKGTVLHPKQPTIKTGTRPRGSKAGDVEDNNFVTIAGDDGQFVVVLTIAEKAPHPAVQGKLDGALGTVQIGPIHVKIDAEAIGRGK